MASSVNRVFLIGRIGKDPESRYLPDGTAICRFSLATSETWKDKNTGEKQERTEWHNIVLFKRLAEIATQYTGKGHQVCIIGQIRTRKWHDDKTGQDKYMTEIIGSELTLLGAPNKDRAQDPSNSYAGNQYGGNQYGGNSQQPARSTTAKPPTTSDPEMGFDDDVPF